MQTIMNKEDKDKSLIEEDPSINNENVDIYIEELLKKLDGSIYGGIKWDKKNKRWILVKM